MNEYGTHMSDAATRVKRCATQEFDGATRLSSHGIRVSGDGTPVTDAATRVKRSATQVFDGGTRVVHHGTRVSDGGTPVFDDATPVFDHAIAVCYDDNSLILNGFIDFATRHRKLVARCKKP